MSAPASICLYGNLHFAQLFYTIQILLSVEQSSGHLFSRPLPKSAQPLTVALGFITQPPLCVEPVQQSLEEL